MVKFFRKGEVLLPEYRIIDAHTHIYPDKIADKAGEAIGSFYNIPIYHTGTAEELLKSGEKIGVDKFLICSAATSPKQVTSINDFIIYECSKHEKFIGFGSVHPDFENIDAELKRIKAAGMGGVKLHPDFQQFLVDDQKALPMWKAIRDNDMFALVHTGDAKLPFSDPRRMAAVLEELPGIKVIAAHFGGYQVWERAYEAYKPGTCLFDISSSIMFMEKELIFKFFDKFGIENFFWGTDFPSQDHEIELNRFFGLGLSEEQNRMLLGVNFARVMGI